MINFQHEIETIHPINIEIMDFDKHKISQDIRNSISLYNKSIANLKAGHADIAIANLKNSISLNPSFCEAIKFLGLCYVYTKEFSSAKKEFKKLKKYDLYSILSESYLDQLETEKKKLKSIDAIKEIPSGFNLKTDQQPLDRKSLIDVHKKKDYSTLCKPSPLKITLVVMIPIIICLTFFAYKLRSNIQATYAKISNAKVSAAKEPSSTPAQNPAVHDSSSKPPAVNDKAPDTATKGNPIQKTESSSNFEKSTDNTKSTSDVPKNNESIASELAAADKLYQSGNYEKAIDQLLLLKTLPLDNSSKEKFDILWNEVKTNAIWKIYNDGNKLYKQEKYEQALPLLLQTEAVAPDSKLMPWIIYQIGMCYKERKDSATAVTFFKRVQTEYPNSEYAQYALSVLRKMNVSSN